MALWNRQPIRWLRLHRSIASQSLRSHPQTTNEAEEECWLYDFHGSSLVCGVYEWASVVSISTSLRVAKGQNPTIQDKGIYYLMGLPLLRRVAYWARYGFDARPAAAWYGVRRAPCGGVVRCCDARLCAWYGSVWAHGFSVAPISRSNMFSVMHSSRAQCRRKRL